MCMKSFSVIMIDASFPLLYHERWHICIKLPGCSFFCRILLVLGGSSSPVYLFVTPKCFCNQCLSITQSLAQLNIAQWNILGFYSFLYSFCEKRRIYHGGPSSCYMHLNAMLAYLHHSLDCAHSPTPCQALMSALDDRKMQLYHESKHMVLIVYPFHIFSLSQHETLRADDFNPMQGLLQMQQCQGLPGKEAC